LDLEAVSPAEAARRRLNEADDHRRQKKEETWTALPPAASSRPTWELIDVSGNCSLQPFQSYRTLGFENPLRVSLDADCIDVFALSSD
jgi:hypothetical protein